MKKNKKIKSPPALEKRSLQFAASSVASVPSSSLLIYIWVRTCHFYYVQMLYIYIHNAGEIYTRNIIHLEIFQRIKTSSRRGKSRRTYYKIAGRRMRTRSLIMTHNRCTDIQHVHNSISVVPIPSWFVSVN